MEKWFVINKGADFAGIAKRFGISPVTARLIRNREVMGDEAIARYLKGGIGELYDPHLLLDSDRLTDILVQKISEQKKIRVIGDYDIDGVMSTYILYKGITRCGGSVDFQIPDRMKDGYGINDHLIEQADEAGIDTIITCDNGIAAIGEIAHAKSLGMTVLVTDHHEIPYTEERGERHYKRSEADAIVNPKQMECTYPYKNLCGAAVAWKVIQILYEKCDIAVEESYDFLENVAFATVGDVMDLTDENRILVREGLKRIHTTMNPGMRALILQNKLEPEQISSYHFGFVLGPCINASGRLETAKIALNLFLQEDVKKASEIAAELVDLNAQRKDMTAEGVELAMQQVEEGNTGEKVLVVYLPDCHESIAGIIAGRLKERYYRPTFVLTKTENGAKGSGRSIEAYDMFAEMNRCAELFTRFGGHKLAAGLSLPEEKIGLFRKKINELAQLTEEDMQERVSIDLCLPFEYIDENLIAELKRLEPFGMGNEKPKFAERNLSVIDPRIFGKNRNVLKCRLRNERGMQMDGIYFGDVEDCLKVMEQRKVMPLTFYPKINEYMGKRSIQLEIVNYQ